MKFRSSNSMLFDRRFGLVFYELMVRSMIFCSPRYMKTKTQKVPQRSPRRYANNRALHFGIHCLRGFQFVSQFHTQQFVTVPLERIQLITLWCTKTKHMRTTESYLPGTYMTHDLNRGISTIT